MPFVQNGYSFRSLDRQVEGLWRQMTPIAQKERTSMFRMTTRGGLAAMGIAMGLAMTAGIQASSAQDGPRALPGFQTQQQRDQSGYDRRDDRVQGDQYDGRDAR